MNICIDKDELNFRKERNMDECENICCKDCEDDTCPVIEPCRIYSLYLNDKFWYDKNLKFECEYYKDIT